MNALGERRYLEIKIGTADDLQDVNEVVLGHAPDDGPLHDRQGLEVYFAERKRRHHPKPGSRLDPTRPDSWAFGPSARRLIHAQSKRPPFGVMSRSRRPGAGLGVPVLVALCGGLLGRNTRGGTVVVGALNLGGSIEMIPNAVRIAELAIDKQAQTLLMPVSARRQLNDLPDDLWTKISIEFYKDGADAVFKALME